MLKRFFFFLLLGALNVSMLFSAAKHWEVSGDFLYLLPSVDDTFFVIVQDRFLPERHDGKKVNNDFAFHSGFRVAASYTTGACRTQFYVDYTQLNARAKKIVYGPVLSAANGTAFATFASDNFFGTASSDLHLFHKRAEALLNQPIWSRSRLQLCAQGGVEFAFNHLAESYVYNSVFPTFQINYADFKSNTWGIGPQIGLGLNYLLYQCQRGSFSIELSGSGSLLSSRSDGSILTRGEGDLFNQIYYDIHMRTWRLVPVAHISLGIDFLTCFRCFNVLFRCGYEFSSYIRGLVRNAFTDELAQGLSYTYYYNFDIQGLYVSASVAF